jgi:Radical SAM superfamily
MSVNLQPIQEIPHVGLLGMESTGLTERAIALDLLHGLVDKSGLRLSFHRDLAFDSRDQVFREIVTAPRIDALLLSMRPTSAYLIHALEKALEERAAGGGSTPLIAMGGPTALEAGSDLRARFPGAIVCRGDVETEFPLILKALISKSPALAAMRSVRTLLDMPARWFSMPAHHSTARCVAAGGTVWVEASRGCALKCVFCILSAEDIPTAWFPRPVDDLLDEIEYLQREFGVTDVSFADYSSFETKDYVDEFLQKVSLRGLRFTFRCDMRLGTARRLRHRLPELHAAGLRAIYTGIESFVPEQRRLYKKGYPGKEIIDYVQSLGIFVAVGFIMLDPLYTPAQFQMQVRGVREQCLLRNIATTFKTMRVQRNTAYEKIVLDKGIVTGINPDLYTYSYRCADPRMEIIRQVMEFLHQTTKDIYYQPYIENNIRQRGDLDTDRLAVLAEITYRYKRLQIEFLESLADIAVTNTSVDTVARLISADTRAFCARRREVFVETARDYQALLDTGLQHYHEDLQKFIEVHESVPDYDESIIDIPRPSSSAGDELT